MATSNNAYKYYDYDNYYPDDRGAVRKAESDGSAEYYYDTPDRTMTIGDWDDVPERVRRRDPRKQHVKAHTPQGSTKMAFIHLPQTGVLNMRRFAADLLVVVALFGIFSFAIYRYANISSMNLQNDELRTQIEKVDAVIEQKTVELASETDLQQVQTVAENKLGMQFPNNEQVKYIQIEKGTENTTASAEKAKASPGFLQSIADFVSGLFK